jgi:hypothetical protein
MVDQQQLQRPPFPVDPHPSVQHNVFSQFQNRQMTAPQFQAAFQQNRPTPAMFASLQPIQARQLELMMAQHQPPHNNPVGVVNPSQPVQQGFPRGMIDGNPNPEQPSQGKLLYCHFRPSLTSNLSQPYQCSSNAQWHDSSGYKTRCVGRVARSGSAPPHEHQSH